MVSYKNRLKPPRLTAGPTPIIAQPTPTKHAKAVLKNKHKQTAKRTVKRDAIIEFRAAREATLALPAKAERGTYFDS
jgi:hypothetical protein